MSYEFTRAELILGKEALSNLANSKVAVFGVGGVGGYVVEGLARCGIGEFVLVDNDIVDITNINRQIIATHKTIGRPKVEVAKERILEINPKAKVITHQVFYLPGNANEVIEDNYNYIVDAIDTVSAKIDLVVESKKRNIPIISCMGMGNKIDPTKIEISDLFKTSICPLAKTLRKELRKREISSLKVVYSKEEPIKPENLCDGDCNDESCITKRQIPGSVSFVPSVGGLIIAGEVIKDLIRI